MLGFPGCSVGKELPAMQGTQTDASSIPGSGRSPRGGYGKPLQYSCLENPEYRGVWWATVHSVAISQMTEETEHRQMQVSVLMFLGVSILTVKEEAHNYGMEEVKKEPGI